MFKKIKTIKILLNRVKNNISSEDNIIIVDDGSTDGTTHFLKTIKEKNIRVLIYQ